MKLANSELSKILYNISGWKVKPVNPFSAVPDPYSYYEDGVFLCYRYDLGYLLRKLPPTIESNNKAKYYLKIEPSNYHNGLWSVNYFYYDYDNESPYFTLADNNIEDAAAQLAIKLFEQNILRKDPS